MKKKLLAGLTTWFFLFSMVGIASATSVCSGLDCPEGTVEYTDTYDPANVKLNARRNDHANWTFNLTSNSGVDHYGNYGFDPLTENIIQADISLNLSDDFGFLFIDLLFIPEWARLESEGSVLKSWEVDFGTTVGLSSLASLNADGSIGMDLWATSGDFYFKSATLTGCAAPVPEPATMFLFGIGIVGLAGTRIRRKKK